ncbi:hypothetical protein F4805DRAFT_158259 [Annulohypoxylon moriforme]|nr:hypothetical protein F4805DRAFT_158259 [Annulohypoxylon moriforme]
MQPSEDEILAALAHYRAAVLESNRDAISYFVHFAETTQPAEGDKRSAEGIAKRRREFLHNLLYYSRSQKSDPSLSIDVPSDVMTKWDAMVPAFGLDGVYISPDSEHRRELCAAYKSGVEAGLRSVGVDLEFPADFEFLMGQVDCLVGNGWPQYREEGQQVCFWYGLEQNMGDISEYVIGPDDDPARKTSLDFEEYECKAAWECGRGPEETCFVAYCRQEEDGKDWAWRYVADLGQYGQEVFDNLVELLQWYETLLKPDPDRYNNHHPWTLFK